MKIVVLASNEGNKALYLYDFFKEGNRIETDCLITDTPDSPLAVKFNAEGIKIFDLRNPDVMDEIMTRLQSDGVEILAVDGFHAEIPQALREFFGDHIVVLSSPERGPIEVIEAVKKLNAATTPAQPAEQPKAVISQGKLEVSPQDQEWADALKVDLSEENAPSDVPATEEPTRADAVKPESDEQPTQNPSPNQWYSQGPAPVNPQSYGPQNPVQAPYPQAGQNPQMQYQAPREPMPDTYLVWSVIITILCCLIPGIIAIVYSASVSSKYYAGNIEGAKRASRNAQIWCIVSVVAGVIWATLYIPLALLVS